VEGREVRYTLAERAVDVLPGFRMREVRRLSDDGGHQTAILTTRTDLPIAVVGIGLPRACSGLVQASASLSFSELGAVAPG